MNYQETITYLYDRLPVFHRIGKSALKPGLKNITALCEYLDNPQQKFKSIHVGGTNGKGSTSHFLASVLQTAGYKVGLHTSPHLKSFTERFKINGQPIDENEITDFVIRHKNFIEISEPSFFEISVAMAFDFFEKHKVDVAIIEVGLGGRLDSTNIIQPELSVITNIGYDHVDILGDTLEKIATEKAGIIKPKTPVVISETHPETQNVFIEKANNFDSDIYFADQLLQIIESKFVDNKRKILIRDLKEKKVTNFTLDFLGNYQVKNLMGVLQSIKILNKNGWKIPELSVIDGIRNVSKNTNLKGRWQVLQSNPTVVADVAHNYNGFVEIIETIHHYKFNELHFVLGFVKDKDVQKILELLPQNAHFYFCQPSNFRALAVTDLQKLAFELGITGLVFENVIEAVEFAKSKADKNDFIYIGGSTFVVAELPEN